MKSYRIRIAVVDLGDSESLIEMFGRCSSTALYRRFHGVTNGIFYARQVLATANARDSYLAWIGKQCVGLGNLHVSDDTANVGVLVEDDWQRRGVGTALLFALIHRAREHGSHFLRADVLDENRFILQMLARLGPAKTSLSAGSYSTVVELTAGTILGQPLQPTEPAPSHPSGCAERCLLERHEYTDSTSNSGYSSAM
jgi:GNAT superfamily N-acetyltransferase